MSRHATAPEDRVPLAHKVAYGAGAFVNNTLAAAIGGMSIVLNLGLGMNPAWVGLLGAIPRLTDAFTDPLVGYLSDNTRSRWGRRRPWIAGGAITVGLIYILLWQLPVAAGNTVVFWWFLVGSMLFYLAYTAFATPWVALGYELTPDYHERTRLMGVQNFIGQLAYVVAPWFLWIMTNEAWFDDQVEGAAALAVVIAVVAIALGILPAVFLRERFVDSADEAPKKTLTETGVDFWTGLITTLKSVPFLQLCAATFLVFNGFILISAFQSYVIIYYVFGGDQARGAEFVGWSGSVGAASTFAVIAIVTWLGTKIGKRRAFFVSTGLSIVGYLLKWFCYDPSMPWLLLVPAPLMAFGLGGLFTLVPSMVADVVDQDELETHQRREGMYGSIFWWVVKLGMSVAIAGGGFLLNWTGFDVALEGAQTADAIYWMRVCDVVVPAVTSALAIVAIASYGITEEVAQTTRETLEARRGKTA